MNSICALLFLTLAALADKSVAFVTMPGQTWSGSVVGVSVSVAVLPPRPSSRSILSKSHHCHQYHHNNRVVPCYMALKDESTNVSNDETEETDTTTSVASQQQEPTPVVAATTEVKEDDEQPYPVDLPSPVLLATSMVSAIAGVGT